MSRYQKGKTRKGKTNLDLLEQEIMSGSGICWAMCKSAPHPRQPRQHPTTQFFTGRMPFLLPNQQRQSTEQLSQKMLRCHTCSKCIYGCCTSFVHCMLVFRWLQFLTVKSVTCQLMSSLTVVILMNMKLVMCRQVAVAVSYLTASR